MPDCATRSCVERGEKTFEECIKCEAELKMELRRLEEQRHKLEKENREMKRKIKAEEKKYDRLLSQLPTDRLISYMVDRGLEVSEKLALEVAGRGDEAVPYLLDILMSDSHWRKGGPGDGWAPIHAIHILPKIGSKAALDAILYAIRERPEDLGDWLTEDIPSILAHFGTLAFGSAKELVEDPSLDPFVRSSAARALCAIAKKVPDRRKAVVSMLRERIRDPNEDEEFASLIMDDLAEFRDPEALQDLKEAFPGDLEFIENIYQRKDEWDVHRRDMKDPIEFFSTQNISRLRNINYGGREGKWKEKRAFPSTSKKRSKVGRNAPCPCGSGKKYKKCCLKVGKR